MFIESFKGVSRQVSRKFQINFKDVSTQIKSVSSKRVPRVFERTLKGVLGKFQQYLRKFQRSFKSFHKSFKSISRYFQGCFNED